MKGEGGAGCIPRALLDRNPLIHAVRTNCVSAVAAYDVRVRGLVCATCDSHDRWNSQPVINKVALCAYVRLHDSAYLYQPVVYCQW